VSARLTCSISWERHTPRLMTGAQHGGSPQVPRTKVDVQSVKRGVKSCAPVSSALGEDGSMRVLIVETRRNLADYIADGLRTKHGRDVCLRRSTGLEKPC